MIRFYRLRFPHLSSGVIDSQEEGLLRSSPISPITKQLGCWGSCAISLGAVNYYKRMTFCSRPYRLVLGMISTTNQPINQSAQ